MGREIRKVPKDWKHPQRDDGFFKPLHHDDYESACKEWWEAASKWHRFPVTEEQKKLQKEYRWYWDYAGTPPNKEFHREEFKKKADCYQIYETVSEGTPVSPVFSTEKEMIEWMVQPIDRHSPYNGGQDWQTMQGMTREQAENFVRTGFSMSLVFSQETGLKAGHRT